MLSILLGAFYSLLVLSIALLVGSFLHEAARSYALSTASVPTIEEAGSAGAASDPQEASGAATDAEASIDPGQEAAKAVVEPPQPLINVLLLGSDEREDENGPARTDTMMLFSLNLETQTVGMISLPRDLWVPIPGYDITTKINTAYVIGEARGYPGGGAQLAKDTVSSLVGRPVDYYVRLNFDGFVRFIDLIDGIDVHVPKTIHDDRYPTDDYGYEVFHLEAGPQHLDGETALKYVRTRNVDSDYMRAQRQQQVIQAVMEKVLKADMLPTLIAKAPQLMATMRNSIDTDIPIAVAIDVASYVRQNSLREVRRLVLDNRFGDEAFNDDGAWVLLPDRSRIRPALSQFFQTTGSTNETNFSTETPLLTNAGQRGSQTTATEPSVRAPASLRLEVLNGTNTPGVAARVRDALQAEGWQVVAIGDADRSDYRRTLIVNYNADDDLVAQVIRTLQMPSNLPQLNGLGTSHNFDLRIVVGQDFVKNGLELGN